MNRIDKKFQVLKETKSKAFVAFVTAGDPSFRETEELVLSMEKAGVDLIELGLPFSDPLADGPTIQASSQRSIKKGFTLEKAFALVKHLRTKTDIPICFMMYYNPIFHYGEEKFVKKAKEVGIDGLIVPDLPPEEGHLCHHFCENEEIRLIPFVSPTTSERRIRQIAASAKGFIYYVAITGVTGARSSLAASFDHQIKKIKKFTQTPVCVGFGVSTPQQAKRMAQKADGVIVGSAIIHRITAAKSAKQRIQTVNSFVKTLIKAVK